MYILMYMEWLANRDLLDSKSKILYLQDCKADKDCISCSFLFPALLLCVNRRLYFHPTIPTSRIYDLLNQDCFHIDFFCLSFYQFLVLRKMYINIGIAILTVLQFFQVSQNVSYLQPSSKRVDIFLQYLHFL